MSATPSSSIADLKIPGGWTTRPVTIGSRTFKLLVPAHPDEFLNHLVEPIDASQPHLADPYWAKLWPAAEHLAAAILGAPDRDPQSCLELGCGSGLAGLAALAAGWEVTFSDYVPQAVQLAQENAARNGFDRARGLVFDWSSPPALQFPRIIAADVTYDRALLRPLLTALEKLLAPGGEAWIADAGRGPVAEFLRLAAERGWSVALLDERGRASPEPALGRCQRIILRRAAPA
jgi:predicted nicotinamide N-methyase